MADLYQPVVLLPGNRMGGVPSGGILNAAVAGKETAEMENSSGGNITWLQTVYVKSDGTVAPARANASGTAEAAGLVAQPTIANEAEGTIQTNGRIEADTEDWDAVTGQTGGLSPGKFYILSPDTAGQMIPIDSDTITAGQYITVVGKALTTTAFKIEPEISIPVSA